MPKYNITPFIKTEQLYRLVEKAEDTVELCDILSHCDRYMFYDLYSYIVTFRADPDQAERLESLWRFVRDGWASRA